MSKTVIRKLKIILLSGLIMVLEIGSQAIPAYAAAYTETVGGPTVSAPAGVNFTAVNQFANNVMSLTSPGYTQDIIATRTPGVNSFNLNLDAPDVADPTDVTSSEVAMLSIQSAYQCDPSTAVTITVTDWELTITASTLGTIGGGGGGLINITNPVYMDPASSTVYSGSGFNSIPETQTVSGGSFATTFAELPNYIFAVGASVRNDDGDTPGDPSDDSQVSYSFTVPTIQLEYDNTGCKLIQTSTSNGGSTANTNSSTAASALAETGDNWWMLMYISVSFAVASAAIYETRES